ncbi:MAG: HAMP domain-containing protein [Holosporales bacterium]|jgi:two-component system nitrogen regulation sensor histidine kinase NtrY|nr:HAMP domain-containing protein [Holosporales bacterium]
MRALAKLLKRRYVTYSLMGCTAASFAATWLFINFRKEIPLNPGLIIVSLCVNAALLALLCRIFVKRIRKIVNFRNKENRKKLFHRQVIMLFSCVTVIPAICVFVFAILFFNIGIENLFKSPVRNVIINAKSVASIYVDDVKLNLENFANGLSEEIRSCVNGLSINTTKAQDIINAETSNLKVDVAVLRSAGVGDINIVANTPFSISLQYEDLPGEIELLDGGGVITWESGDRVIACSVINRVLGIYLIAAIPIDKTILEHKHKIKAAIMEYTSLATQRAGIKISFVVVFAVTTIFLLLIAILLGVSFANRILKPINKLIIATKNVAAGDYNTPIRANAFRNEWDMLIAAFNDMMTRLERQKRQLIVSNRHSAWRDIARKIAHEIKNPLTPIQLSAERLKSKYEKEIVTQPEIFESCVSTIVRQVNCIGKLVKEFSDFARMPTPKFEKINLTKLLREIVFMHANTNMGIRFNQDYDNERLICEVDQDQMNRMVMNVLQNAVNAVSENVGGATDGHIGNISVCMREVGDVAQITVEDDGPGFSDTALGKALDPYYTTRANGTGLGLSIVHKVVTDHFGEIVLGKSQTLSGASVTISLPKKQPEISEADHGV